MPPFAKRSLGQNFLVDPNIIRKIASAINAQPDEKILEIGPGHGALTALLLQSGARLSAIELDSILAAKLKAQYARNQNFFLYEGDALKSSWQPFLPLSQIVGNLPYNIASQLILKFFQNSQMIHRAVFMVQKDFADRLFSEAGSKVYGIVSVYFQLYAKGKILLKIPPSVFRPRPKVDSALIELRPNKELPLPNGDLLLFHSLVRLAFNQRRKTLRNSLKRYYKAELADSFPWEKRPESLALEDFLKLFSLLKESIISDCELKPGELPPNLIF